MSTQAATPEIYTLSLHDALPISRPKYLPVLRMRKRHRATGRARRPRAELGHVRVDRHREIHLERQDRKSTRLNSSHTVSSYAVFCLKKKKREPPAATSYPVRHQC